MGKRTKVAASPIGEHLEARSSSPTWETLRDWLRGKIRELMQGLLEEEVTEFLGRARYERRAAVDACGYRNGYGKPRKLLTPMGTVTLRRPRVLGLGGPRIMSQPLLEGSRKDGLAGGICGQWGAGCWWLLRKAFYSG